MLSRLLLSGALALCLLSGVAAFMSPAFAQEKSGGILGRFGLPGVFGGNDDEEVVAPAPSTQFAQATDPRITALEEQVRSLSGQIEELNFQLLQMQEQMRKQQEDNEFRFQELEKKSGVVRRSDRVVASAPTDTVPAAGSEPTVTMLPDGVEDGTASSRALGTITVDRQGNISSSGGSAPLEDLDDEPMDTHSDGTTVASLPSTEDPEELYRNSYEFILSGDYDTAETGFRDHIARFPSDPRSADAHFWLGESLLGQQKYRDAAETFLAANKNYPDSKKAPDMLFKLGVSLAGLNQRDDACATFGEVAKRYPGSSASLKDRVKQEQAVAGC
jgi:tol-pal system protein YbgF